MNNKNKILFLLHLPPPIHGASMMGKHLKDSDYLKENFNCYFINMSASNKVDEVGKLSVRKMFFLITNLYNILKWKTTNSRTFWSSPTQTADHPSCLKVQQKGS